MYAGNATISMLGCRVDWFFLSKKEIILSKKKEKRVDWFVFFV